jgi:hypothetical protein
MLMPPGRSIVALDELHGIKLNLVDERGMVIVGVEEIWRRKERFDFPQAWWCRVIDPVVYARSLQQGRDPLDAEEEREQIQESAFG